MDKKQVTLDLSKLLGFDAVADLNGSAVDFRKDAIASRLGAKVGEATTPATRKND